MGSLCLNAAGDGLAMADKGKTAAELMVFARYVMFSEVYWHHGVRAATAMLQRAFYLLHGLLDLDALFRMTEHEMIDELAARGRAEGRPASCSTGCSVPRGSSTSGWRSTASSNTASSTNGWPGGRIPGWWPVPSDLRRSSARRLGRVVAPHELLFDAPPVTREVQFDVEIHFPKENCYRPLGEVSPVIRALATEQFDDYVKRVRIFAHPRLVAELRRLPDLTELLDRAIAADGMTNRPAVLVPRE